MRLSSKEEEEGDGHLDYRQQQGWGGTPEMGETGKILDMLV